MPNEIIDHLFRHQFGKMVSILTKKFGFQHLETIEDAVQDTFIKAINTWRDKVPENPEAWLTAAAKNRMIDIFRSINAEKERPAKMEKVIEALKLEELFLDDEVEDSQLRMIFTACHPMLDPKEQIAFALKTISGFSINEIASALLAKQETIKKRLQRARKLIATENIEFEIPSGQELSSRLARVLEVLYVIFSEGFHSNKKEIVIRKDLCAEAMRLLKMMINKPILRTNNAHALFALMCFHAARLEAKVNEQNELINLSKQDRSKWHMPLIFMGNEAMNKAVEGIDRFSSYHYEAAIASEHLRAPSFDKTNWKIIDQWYRELYKLQASANIKLSIAVVNLQLNNFKESKLFLDDIDPAKLAQKAHLYYATFAEYYFKTKDKEKSLKNILLALSKVTNKSEYKFFLSKKRKYESA